MKVVYFIILTYFLMPCSSCSNQEITNNDIDKFISKYHDETFSDFIGAEAFPKNRTVEIYIIS